MYINDGTYDQLSQIFAASSQKEPTRSFSTLRRTFPSELMDISPTNTVSTGSFKVRSRPDRALA
jgi:hypothetical protein